MRLTFLVGLVLSIATLARADGDARPSGKFSVDGSTLVYDGARAREGASTEIEADDVDELLLMLATHQDITTLQLSSGGGSVWAGNEMARVVLDYELDTRVVGECSSSCVTIFLAGRARDMARGSKIGFHQRSWSEAAIQAYYERWREEEGWDTPFAFASWVYEDTQTEIYKELSYMVSRGVDPAFAIETKRLRASMWFPGRSELRAAGVLRD